MPLITVRNDITKMNTEAVVLPANRELHQGSGTSRAIYEAAGEEKVANELRFRYPDGCLMGQAVATAGYNLSAKYNRVFREITEYIDSRYVEEKDESYADYESRRFRIEREMMAEFRSEELPPVKDICASIGDQSYASSIDDQIESFFLENENYNIDDINITLERLGIEDYFGYN